MIGLGYAECLVPLKPQPALSQTLQLQTPFHHVRPCHFQSIVVKTIHISHIGGLLQDALPSAEIPEEDNICLISPKSLQGWA